MFRFDAFSGCMRWSHHSGWQYVATIRNKARLPESIYWCLNKLHFTMIHKKKKKNSRWIIRRIRACAKKKEWLDISGYTLSRASSWEVVMNLKSRLLVTGWKSLLHKFAMIWDLLFLLLYCIFLLFSAIRIPISATEDDDRGSTASQLSERVEHGRKARTCTVFICIYQHVLWISTSLFINISINANNFNSVTFPRIRDTLNLVKHSASFKSFQWFLFTWNVARVIWLGPSCWLWTKQIQVKRLFQPWV